MAFILVLFLFFLLLTVMGTRPVQLLFGTVLPMPIFNVNITLTLFYAAAPSLLFLFHVYIVLQVAHVIRRGTFKSVADLQDAIKRYIREHNKAPKPFVWTKSADTILAKLSRLPLPSE